ncbi:hypothetical protein E1J38_002615 [Seonamhaeicola sediminis]|uniref:Lipocalin-like domain-containing protein n=1 Tax=Seonamhaeicola sediminis TaxID=2528206 RepID=A0A562YI69_9FLAO|nr:hypothetical protein [Seonamhaeicola sediminis]TWO34770.1 hypothetical protein E1J38_002615 [Seonamhaeicola sediminis]
MKTFITLLVCLISISITKAQETGLIGTWNIFEFEVINNDDINTRTHENLFSENSIWDLFFMDNKSFKQSSNMRSGELESHKGLWETSKENLKLSLMVQEQKIVLNYNYKLKDNILVLRRVNPKGTLKLKITFIKKEEHKSK